MERGVFFVWFWFKVLVRWRVLIFAFSFRVFVGVRVLYGGALGVRGFRVEFRVGACYV